MFYLSQPIAGLLLLTSQLFSGRYSIQTIQKIQKIQNIQTIQKIQKIQKINKCL